MQYPIIDNLIYAYTANGWTGLILTYGKNLLPNQNWELGQYNNGVWVAGNTKLTSEYVEIEPNKDYTMSIDTDNTVNLAWINYNYFDEDKNYLGNRTTNGQAAFSGQKIVTFNISNANAKYIRLTARDYTNNSADISGVDMDLAEPQLELGNSFTSFEYYRVPETDIDKRLKLPLIHYFPHAVIDALISAADGHQTAEENEILRHYLTPLGIGGI